ncbi:MAG TPA: tail fiber protein [Pyrinomonadaceae bacterium]|jgi:microcystin-dependent protein
MSTPFLGEIKIISWNFAQQGWAFCNGQQLPIAQNQALFSLFGTTYGGNGQTTFALPDLRGRTPIHFGNGFTLGERAGEQAHTLTTSEMPTHTHFAMGNNAGATVSSPLGNFWSNGGDNIYAPSPANNLMRPGTIANVGGNQAHNNMTPYLVLNFMVALVGIFPSQN